MKKKYNLTLLMLAQCVYAALPIIETNNSFSAAELIKYKDDKLFIKGRPSIDKAQANSLIYTKTDLDFGTFTWPNEQEITDRLKAFKLTAEKTELVEKNTTIEFLANGLSKEHTALTFLLQADGTQPTLFSYNPILANAKINKVLLYTPGKAILTLDPKQLVRAKSQANNKQFKTYMATSYSHNKRLLYVEYQLTTFIPHLNNQISQSINFQDCKNSLKLIVPKSLNLKYSSNFGTPSHIENNYTWKIEEGHNQKKPLYLTTYLDWKEITKRRQVEFQTPMTTTKEISALARDITKTSINNKERVEISYNWIQTHIRHDQASVTDILLKRRGDLKSRTILLNQMLIGLGIKSSLALTFPPDTEIAYNDYQNIICTFVLENKTHYLDLSSPYFRFPYFPENNIGMRIIELESGHSSTIKPQAVTLSNVTKTLELTLVGNKMKYRLDSIYTGKEEALIRERHKMLSVEQFENIFIKKIGLDSDEVTSFKLLNANNFEKPLTSQIDYTRLKQVITTDKQKLFYIPELKEEGTGDQTVSSWDIKIKVPEAYSATAREEVSLKDSTNQIVLSKTEEVKDQWLYIKLTFSKNNNCDSGVRMKLNYILSQPIIFNKTR